MGVMNDVRVVIGEAAGVPEHEMAVLWSHAQGEQVSVLQLQIRPEGKRDDVVDLQVIDPATGDAQRMDLKKSVANFIPSWRSLL